MKDIVNWVTVCLLNVNYYVQPSTFQVPALQSADSVCLKLL